MPTQVLTVSQYWSLVCLGIVYWFGALLKIRYFAHHLYGHHGTRLFIYLATIPIGYLMILFPEVLLGIDSVHRLTTIAVVSATAFIIDGVVLMWFPALYENETIRKRNPNLAIIVSRMGAASLLYRTGVCISLALITQ